MSDDWRGIPEEYRNAIVTGDARELAKRIPDESVDLIFTDPPYLREYLPLYEWLAKESVRLLKPKGFLIAYVGTYWKDKVMNLLNEYLEYFWDFILENTGNSPIVWQRKIISRHKSLMAYCLKDSGALPRTNVLSFWRGSGEDKRWHTWGQDESSCRYYADCFSEQGEIIFDPFSGGGTTIAIAKTLGRNYLGFEIDPATAEIARKRVAETQPPLFTLQPEQLTMEALCSTPTD